MTNSEVIRKYNAFKKQRAEQLRIAKDLWDKCNVRVKQSVIDSCLKRHIKQELRLFSRNIPSFKNVYKRKEALAKRKEKFLARSKTEKYRNEYKRQFMEGEYYYYFKDSARDRMFVEVKKPIGINPRWKQIKDDTGLSCENYQELANLKMSGVKEVTIAFLEKKLSIVEAPPNVKGCVKCR